MSGTTHNIRIRMDTSEADAGTKRMRSGLGRVDKGALSINKTLAAMLRELRRLTAMMRQFSGIGASAFTKLTAEANAAAVAIERMNVAAATTGRVVKTAAVATGLWATVIANVQSNMKALLAQLTAFLGIAGAFFAVTGLADFEQNMSTVLGVTHATDAQMAKLRKRAQDVAASGRFMAQEVALGMVELAKAGLNVNEVYESIIPTMNLAQAANLDVGRASEITSKVMRAMNLEVKDLTRVTDVLVKAANISTTNVNNLGEVFKYVAPIMAGFNVSLEETAALSAVLASNGLEASMAGTSMRSIFSRLSGPTKEFRKQLKALHVDVKNIQPGIHGAVEILERLKKAGVSESELMSLFKMRAGSGAMILVKNVGVLKEYLKTIHGAAGSTQELSDVMNDNLKGAFLNLLATVMNLVIALGDSGLGAALKMLINTIATLVSGLAQVISFLGPVFKAFAVAFLVVNIPAMITGLGALGAAFQAMAARAVASIMSIVAAMGPIAWIVFAITAAITLLVQFSDQIKITGTGAATLADLFAVIWDKVVWALKKVYDFFIWAFGGMFDFGKKVADAILYAFQFMANGILKILQTIMNQAVSVINFVGKYHPLGGMVGGGNIEKFDFASGGIKALTTENIANALGAQDLLAEAEARAQKRIAAETKAAAQQKAILDALAEASKGLGSETNRLGMEQDGAAGKTKKLTTQLDRQKKLLEQINGPAIEAKANIQALNSLYESGKISLSQYNDYLQRLRETMLSQDQTFFGGIMRGLNEVAGGFTRLGEHVGKFVSGAFQKATDAIVEFAKTGKFDFKKLIDSILEDLLRLSLNALWGQLAHGLLGGLGGGIGGGGGGGGGLLGGLFGFATGGDAIVGGSGGTDSQLVGFMATPGERLSVRTPAQQRAESDNRPVHVAPPQVNVRVVNSTDPRASLDAMATAAGERVIINMIQRNPQTFRKILGVA